MAKQLRCMLALLVLVLVVVTSACSGNSATGPTPNPTPVPAPPSGPTLSSILIDGQPSITAGKELVYRSIAMMSDGTATDVSKDTSWSSSLPDVATVDAIGHVKGIKPGLTQLKALYKGVLGVRNVSVAAPDDALKSVLIGFIGTFGAKLPAGSRTSYSVSPPPGFVDGPGTVSFDGNLVTDPPGLVCPTVQYGVFLSSAEEIAYIKSRGCTLPRAHFQSVYGLAWMFANNSDNPAGGSGVSIRYTKD